MPFFNIFKFIKKPQNINPPDSVVIDGVIVLRIDAYLLTSKIAKGIISGNTGHAFVIDRQNIFLYHHEIDFIGRNSLEVREEKGPGIPFEKIDDIQRNHMLKGKEGTDWFISGWHRGEVGQIKKLIAYTPIHFDEELNKLWSIAVVAPVTEVEGAIQAIQTQQFLIQLTVILGTLVLGTFYIFILVNWSTALQNQVDKKTQDLKLSEERYKSLVENADDIIFTIDHSGKYLSMNKYGCKFFNKTPDEIIGQSIKNIIPNPFDEVVTTVIVDVFANKESVKFTHFVKIGENEYWLNTIMRRLYDEVGNTYAVLGISRDITVTKKKEIEEQMYHTEKLASMGTLAAGVAHEINNPLAIILGFSDLLLERYPPESDEYGMLKTIEKHALNAKKVVQGLLSFARYTEQKEEVCNVNKDIELVLNVVKNALALNNINIVEELESELPAVKGDPGKFQQVFLNLINNAIHAMNKGGTLTIQTKSLDNKNIEIKFSDTGHGIAPEHRNKIFDPLFTTKKVGEGTGLGLSVCYGIVTQYGGKITFETKIKEESSTTGTTFIITLPVAKHE
jgi:PAS domain S-box-containing protein